MTLDRLIKAATSHVETVKVTRTGINPMLWIVGLVTPGGMVLSVLTESPGLRVALFTLAALAPLLATVAYFVLLFRRPEMLESEEYRLRRYALFKAYKHGASPDTVEVTGEIARLESGTLRGRRED